MSTIKRKSFNAINKIYFFTATIHKWLPLLLEDNNQQLNIDYLKKLSDEGYITVYGFVLMPNHTHLIWKQNKLNGKETPQGSFLKYTSHEFLKKLKAVTTYASMVFGLFGLGNIGSGAADIEKVKGKLSWQSVTEYCNNIDQLPSGALGLNKLSPEQLKAMRVTTEVMLNAAIAEGKAEAAVNAMRKALAKINAATGNGAAAAGYVASNSRKFTNILSNLPSGSIGSNPLYNAFAKLELEGKLTTKFAGNVEEVLYNEKKIGVIGANNEFTASDNFVNSTADEVAEVLGDGTKSINCKSGLCEVVPGGCVTANTPIATSNGDVLAKDIQAGMYVKSYDETSKTTALGKVKNVFTRGVAKMYNLFVGKDTLQLTSNHPVYTKVSNTWRYLATDSLAKGMLLLTLAGDITTIDSITTYVKPTTVYNFEIENYHNYYAGNTGYLVHNDGGCWVKKYTNLQDMDGAFFAAFVGKEDKLKLFDNLFGSNAAIKNQFKNGGTYRIKAWLMQAEEISPTSKLLTDPGNIAALSKMHDEMAVFANLDGVPSFVGLTNEKRMQHYLSIIKNESPCNTCLPNGGSNVSVIMMPTLEEQWNNIKLITSDIKYSKFINEAGVFRKSSDGLFVRHGAHFELSKMRSEVNPLNITEVNKQIPGGTKLLDFGTGVRNNNDYNIFECKSIGGATLDEIKNGNWENLDQLLDALGAVPSMSNYHLLFNAAAFGGDPLRAKKAIQGLFKKKGDIIFDKMYANPKLKAGFFAGENDANKAKIFFYTKVNEPITSLTSSTFFNFVK